MKTILNLLLPQERDFLVTPATHKAGTYHSWGKQKHECVFEVQIDAKSLSYLIDAAGYGSRIYELMSITRPGDILHYLWVDFSQLDVELLGKLKERFKNRPDLVIEGLSFIDFDQSFKIFGDEPYPHDLAWRLYIDQESIWQDQLIKLFNVITSIQALIKKSTDYLTQKELSLIENKKHPLGFISSVDRRKLLHFNSPPQWEENQEFFNTVSKLANQENVKSISCSYRGFAIWSILIEAQLKRAERTGKPPQQAIELSGPDEGLGIEVMPENWAGYVHIPYEGMPMANLIFLPSWRVFNPDDAGENGSLQAGLRSATECLYMFSLKDRDFGVLGCANRTEVGNWILYSMKNLTS